jgi:hypothetical protein
MRAPCARSVRRSIRALVASSSAGMPPGPPLSAVLTTIPSCTCSCRPILLRIGPIRPRRAALPDLDGRRRVAARRPGWSPADGEYFRSPRANASRPGSGLGRTPTGSAVAGDAVLAEDHDVAAGRYGAVRPGCGALAAVGPVPDENDVAADGRQVGRGRVIGVAEQAAVAGHGLVSTVPRSGTRSPAINPVTSVVIPR